MTNLFGLFQRNAHQVASTFMLNFTVVCHVAPEEGSVQRGAVPNFCFQALKVHQPI